MSDYPIITRNLEVKPKYRALPLIDIEASHLIHTYDGPVILTDGLEEWQNKLIWPILERRGSSPSWFSDAQYNFLFSWRQGWFLLALGTVLSFDLAMVFWVNYSRTSYAPYLCVISALLWGFLAWYGWVYGPFKICSAWHEQKWRNRR